jgi:hypothetical protein
MPIFLNAEAAIRACGRPGFPQIILATAPKEWYAIPDFINGNREEDE